MEEYRQSHGETAYSRRRFCELYREWLQKIDITMRQNHRAGEIIFVDYARVNIPIADPANGLVGEAQTFVAVLGASWRQPTPQISSVSTPGVAMLDGICIAKHAPHTPEGNPLTTRGARMVATTCGVHFNLSLMKPSSFTPVICAVTSLLFALTPSFSSAQIIVNTTSDASVISDGLCTLREAITNANTNSDTTDEDCMGGGSSPDEIHFNIAGGSTIQSIQPTSELPEITEAVIIDGFTQGCGGGPCIELDGSLTGDGARGLYITGPDSEVKGLIVNSFPNACISITGPSAAYNTIEGNYLGTDATGTVAAGPYAGVIITAGATNNQIGGSTPAERNIISGNTLGGVYIYGSGTSGNQLTGNFIGTDITGTLPLGNRNGVEIYLQATGNVIGGTTSGAMNLISGNPNSGVFIRGAGTMANRVEGNFIGTDITGTVSLPNIRGVYLDEGTTGNFIGGSSPGAGNLISGNTNDGVWITSSGTSSNTVDGNLIGTDVTGLTDLGNGTYGVRINLGAGDNTIGSASADARNVISGNGAAGILIMNAGTTGNTVQGNLIGTDVNGLNPVANTSGGVTIWQGPTGNTIGGDDPLAANTISGNSSHGVQIAGTGTSGNEVKRNQIGTDVTGSSPLPNPAGIMITISASENTIGGTAPNLGNTIAFNTADGVVMTASSGLENAVLGNTFFSNGGLGIDLNDDGATPNDAGDADSSPNLLQNYPDLLAAEYNPVADELTVSYQVDTNPSNATYPLRVEFFVADADYQEGQRFIGFESYSVFDWSACGTSPCTQTASLSVTGLSRGYRLVSTATDDNGNTSEFSAPLEIVVAGSSLYVKAFLEGPFVGPGMTTTLNAGGHVPLSQPFSNPIYDGTKLDFDSVQTLTSMPDSTVDWVLVSLRTGTEAGSEVPGTKHAALIHQRGTITNPEDDSLRFAGVADGVYYLVVRARNNLDIMSWPITVTNGAGSWDFTTGLDPAFNTGSPTSAQKLLEDGVLPEDKIWGMFAGDAKVDGQVQALDFILWVAQTISRATGYQSADFNMDGKVQALDSNLYVANESAGASSQVP